MVLIVTAVAMAGLVLVYMMKKGGREDSMQLKQLRAAIPTVGIQIICGDCSGEGDMPRRTLLDRFGNCAQCGGHSYVLASQYAPYARRRLMQEQASGGRVVPFDANYGQGARPARARKVAV